MQRLEAKIDDPDMATLDRIAAELARHDRTVPSRTRAITWAIRELAARLESPLEGPMTAPPD